MMFLAPLTMERVDAVQINFDRIALAFRDVDNALGTISRKIDQGDGTAQRLADMAKAIDGLSTKYDGLERRVSHLESLAQTQAELARRVTTLEENAAKAAIAAEADRLTNKQSFDVVWRRLEDLENAQGRAREVDTSFFVTREELGAAVTPLEAAVTVVKGRLEGQTKRIDVHDDLIAALRRDLDGLDARLLVLPQLIADVHGLGAEVKRVSSATAALTSRLDSTESLTQALAAITKQIRDNLDGLQARVDQDSARFSTRLDKLATSTAKSLKALEAMINALKAKEANTHPFLSGVDGDPLLTRKRVACLSCDPTTAAELRADAPAGRELRGIVPVGTVVPDPRRPDSARRPPSASKRQGGGGGKAVVVVAPSTPSTQQLDSPRSEGISPYDDHRQQS